MATPPYDPVTSVAKRVGINLAAQAITWGIISTLPFLLALLTAVAGYLQPLPWVYVIVAATVVFAMTANGLLRLSELRARGTAQNKMSFQGIAVGASISRDRNGRPKTLDTVQIGIILQNSAHFPMAYHVDSIETSFESIVNTNPDRTFRGTIIPANSTAIFRDASIDVKKLALDKTLYDGHIKVKVRYGLPGWEKHYVEQNSNVNFAIDPKTGNLSVVGQSDRIV
jgi:hypothetical protein